jgi:hypothetical protein
MVCVPGPTLFRVGNAHEGLLQFKVYGAPGQVGSIFKTKVPSQTPEQEIPTELNVAPQTAKVEFKVL